MEDSLEARVLQRLRFTGPQQGVLHLRRRSRRSALLVQLQCLDLLPSPPCPLLADLLRGLVLTSIRLHAHIAPLVASGLHLCEHCWRHRLDLQVGGQLQARLRAHRHR